MNRKILVGVITILLAFTIVPLQHVDATPTTLHSGINLAGYHWICLESDDWGTHNVWNPANATELAYLVSKGLYNAGFWGQTTLESVADLDGLYAVLAAHPGVVMSPQFIIQMINSSAIQANGFTEFVGISIADPDWWEQTKYNSSGPNYRGDLISKWKEGYERGLWLPEYHGQVGDGASWFLQNCSDGNETAIDAVVNHSTFFRMYPGMSGGVFPYPFSSSEYIYNPIETVALGDCNRSVEDCQDSLTSGLQSFYNLFGYWPETTVASSYLISNNTLAALRNTTIYGVSGLGNGYNSITGLGKSWGWQNFQVFNGISMLTDRSTSYTWDGGGIAQLSTIMGQVNSSFAQGKVAEMNTHKINYVRTIRDVLAPGGVDSALALLDHFLTLANQIYDDIWWLTPPELAQLNLRGYSIQNWSDKIVVRNALPQRSITVHIPSSYDIRHLSINDSQNHLRSYSWNEALRTVSITVPHNETFTIRQGGIPAIRHFLTNDAPYLTSFVPFLMLLVIIFTGCVAILAYVKKGG